MPRQPGYPATRYHPTALVDLSVRSERERLSPAALRAFFNIMSRWKVQRRGCARAAWRRQQRTVLRVGNATPNASWTPIGCTRVSYLIGIFKALHIPARQDHCGRVGAAFPTAIPSSAGETPLELMMRRRHARHADRPPIARCAARGLTHVVRLIRQRDTHRLVPSRYRAPESVLARIADDDARSARDLRPRASHQRSAAGRTAAAAGDRAARARLRRAVVSRHQRGVLPRPSARRAIQRAGPRRVVRGVRVADRADRSRHSIDQSNWLKSNGSTKRSRPTTTTWRISVAGSTTSDGIGVSPTLSIRTATRRHRPSGSDSSTGDRSASSIRVSAGPEVLPRLFPAGGRFQRPPRRAVRVDAFRGRMAIGEAG